MRELKFRAWDSNNKAMISPKFLIVNNKNNFVVATIDCCINCPNDFTENNGCEHLRYMEDYLDGGLYPYPAILMQYTGLHDKDGKEIYEGDIVKDCSFMGNRNHEIKFETEYGGFRPFTWDGGCGCCNAFKLYPSQCEVIGNIYENSELLTK